MDDKTCKTCKHWKLREHRHGLGQCKATPMLYHKEAWVDVGGGDYQNKLVPEAASITAFVQDGSDYVAELLTRPEHGCTMHEPHEEPK